MIPLRKPSPEAHALLARLFAHAARLKRASKPKVEITITINGETTIVGDVPTARAFYG